MENVSGEKTRQSILQSAQRVLTEKGVGGFSMRAIAADCDISVGNLHYHYSSAEKLIAAMIDSVMQQYEQDFETLLAEVNPHSAKHFVDLMEWLVRNSVERQVNRLFRALYEMEKHHPSVASAMDTLYIDMRTMVARRMQLAFPHVEFDKLMDVTCLMAMFSEGSAVLHREGMDPRRSSTEQMVALAREAVQLKLTQLGTKRRKNVD